MIRAERAREIGRALEAAHTQGLGVLFVTCTLRHRQGDDLAKLLDVVLTAWRKVCSWQAGRRLFARCGLVGSIRATECTYGGHGWHPHLHLALVVNRPLTEDELSAFSSELSAIWRRAVVKLGGRVPSLARGVKVVSADRDLDALSDYVSKAQEHVGKERRAIALELARGDLKSGRAGSVMPFELLDDRTGSPVIAALWSEYVTATHGRRAFGWSRGLRERLVPDEAERTDDQILDSVEAGALIGVIDGSLWDRHYRDDPVVLDATLRQAETQDANP